MQNVGGKNTKFIDHFVNCPTPKMTYPKIMKAIKRMYYIINLKYELEKDRDGKVIKIKSRHSKYGSRCSLNNIWGKSQLKRVDVKTDFSRGSPYMGEYKRISPQ